MNRRKFIKSGVATAAVVTVPALLSADAKDSSNWNLVDIDHERHCKKNHIYSVMITLIPAKDFKSTKSEFFTVGGKGLSFDKVYEYVIDNKYIVWCKPADYLILQKMKDKNIIAVSVVFGLSSPYNLQSHNPDSPVDGYEVHFLYK